MAGLIPEIFVLWHPDCALGETLARRIHDWLRPGNGLGPPVYYRSLPAPEEPPGGLPAPLPGEARGSPNARATSSRVTNAQIVLLLIDDHMIVDMAWRYWMTQLASGATPTGQRTLLPIALDATAFNVPAALRDQNFLRPAGLPVPPSDVPGSAEATEVVARSLLKQLTEVLCRLLIGKVVPDAGAPVPPGTAVPSSPPAGESPKILVFLSHAKVDGAGPAKKIRNYIYSQTQLAAFYDENDIPFGSVFKNVLQTNVQGTAAMIVIRSENYARRPWCRRELALFRKPVQQTPIGGQSEQWRLNPVVVVDTTEGGVRTLGIPELGNSPIMRWSTTVKDQEEQVVTMVLRDALLGSFHASMGQTMPNQGDCIVLNWLPDPTTLLHIPRVREGNELRVFYPGRGLSGLELNILDEFFPHIAFHSFEAASA